MATLLGASEIREIAERIDLRPTKKLGQNFVVDSNTCRRIVLLANVTQEDIALEIGPGLGSLTLALLEQAAKVVAIEIDPRLAKELPITAERHGFALENLEVILQDALTIESVSANPTVLVANLPYNVSVPVLLTVLERLQSLRSGIVMVQSEVADRLVAGPGSKTYGAPSVKARWWAELEAAGNVSRSVFWPIPNVDSSLVRFVRHEEPGDAVLRERTFALIDAAFAQRRKMLRSALSELFPGTTATDALERAGIDPTLRGEVLSLEDFITIAQSS